MRTLSLASVLGAALAAVLADDGRRRLMAEAALARTRTLTWDASATGVLRALHAEVLGRTAR